VRVLLLTHYFHPEVGAPQSRLLDLASGLSRSGHEVTVLTGFPNYPDGVIQAPYRGRRFQVEQLGELRVVRTAVYPAANRGVGRRLLNHTSFAVTSIAGAARVGRVDAVIVAAALHRGGGRRHRRAQARAATAQRRGPVARRGDPVRRAER
jgi:hypothetical protein